jgi:hypothetical protein
VCARDARLWSGAGTSFAAPLVSAAAALILATSTSSATPEAPDSKEMRTLLAEGATPPPSPNPRFGAGLLNVAASLHSAAGGPCKAEIGLVRPSSRSLAAVSAHDAGAMTG